MIVGIGVDVVDVERFEALLRRRPKFIDRVLTAREQQHNDGSPRNAASLAARFAAKEAVAKALGGPAGLRWHDCQVLTDAAGRPRLEVRDSVAAACEAAGVTRWQLSLTHDGGVAIAYVVAEG